MTQTNTNSESMLEAIEVVSEAIAETTGRKPFQVAIAVRIALRDAGYHITRIPVRRAKQLQSDEEDAKMAYREGKRCYHTGDTFCPYGAEANKVAWQEGFKDAATEECPAEYSKTPDWV